MYQIFKKSINKNQLKIIAIILLFFVIISLSCSLVFSLLIPEHRLQLWLDDLSWNENRGFHDGESVVIAVIDTKISVEHPDLKGKVLSSYSLLDGEFVLDNSKNNTTSNHGTAIAGIISAYPSTANGVFGIAPHSKLISIEIAQTDSDEISVEKLKKAVDLAVELDVDIINISCGTRKADEELQASIKRACNSGIIVVAAAGNQMNNEILYPAAYKDVIAVGSISRNNETISPKGDFDKNIVYLPGECIVTTSATNEYDSISGTSASTAIMSGIVALILEKSPDIKSSQIVNLIVAQDEVNIYKLLENI